MSKYDSLDNIEEDDAHIYVEDNGENENHVYIESPVIRTYGKRIRDIVLGELNNNNIKGVNVYVYDNNALECTIKCRLRDELVNQGYIFG